jgi:hypothetical protein
MENAGMQREQLAKPLDPWLKKTELEQSLMVLILRHSIIRVNKPDAV